MPTPPTPLLLTLLLLAAATPTLAAEPTPDSLAAEYPAAIAPVLQQFCVKCHGVDKQKGGVDFSKLGEGRGVIRHPKLWAKVAEAVELGDMPPEDARPLSDAAKSALIAWARAASVTVDCTDPKSLDPGPPPLRRLTRFEYTRTVRDLLGVDIDIAEAVGLPDESATTGFDNLADALNLPPVLMEKYYLAADMLLEQVAVTPAEIAKAAGKDVRRRTQMIKARNALFIANPGQLSKRDAAKKILERFAPRAFRRPVGPDEIERLLKLYDAGEKAKLPFERALRLPLKAVLVSPHFLFRIERPPAGPGNGRISDYELATRLSYFLWSTMPDEELFKAAAEKKLSDPAELERQVKRMLASPNARALTDNFAGQWLQIRRLHEARPSQEIFPSFTPEMRADMYEETALFFDDLRRTDGNLLLLLDADYTFLNERLAEHYEIAGIKGPAFQRVALKPEHQRGGLLGMASVLALTSHTHRTAPTLRGKWVLDVILNQPPPPPPPDAGMIDESKKGKEAGSFRELLAMHATQPVCASCHQKLDPLGFGLENYDAIGRWRVSTADDPVDATGVLPGGVRFSGPAELKKIILGKQDQFIASISEHMLAYALGRQLQYDDQCVIRDAAAALKRDRHRFSTLVMTIVKSVPFQYHRRESVRPTASAEKGQP